ncbi:hypothetical protein Clacol_000686 [Clathrus columnatus]|uniref:Uncharacterized protein n=1 Tax=Clathrus columnatus TaxID=1419009 RepID=A0AAV4ZX04_9AGAM|nr:hypothetical protein Clacol_000686 [Clathrus columnatus]
MAGYALVALDMLIGRNTLIEKADCIIGLKSFAMFLWPLQQAHFRDVRLRKIASRTSWAALVALTTSSINIAVLTIEHGVELGWICLASCGLDVTINALVIFAVTGYKPDDNVHMYCSTMNFSVPVTSEAFSRRLSGSVHSSPGPCLPPPVQSKDKVYRAPIGIFSDSKLERYDDLLEKQEDFEEVRSSIPPFQASSAYRFAYSERLDNRFPAGSFGVDRE